MLLTYILRFRQSMIGLTVFHSNSTLPILVFTPSYTSKADNNAGPTDNSIYFTWASRVVLIVEFAVALVYFIHNAHFFTKLGLPLLPTNDVELAEAQPAQPHTAVPGTTDNTAVPPMAPVLQPLTTTESDPVAATAVPDNSDATTLDEASQEGGAADAPEDEDGDRAVSSLPLIFVLR